VARKRYTTVAVDRRRAAIVAWRLEIRRGRFEARTAAHAACRRLKHAVSSREQRQLAKVSLCAVGARLRLKTHRV
jgi:hypothetical protein